MALLADTNKASVSLNIRATQAFLEQLFPAPRDFEVRLWDQSLLGFTSTPRFTLVLHSPGVLRRMLRPPVELSVAEAFIRGDFDIEGDIFAAVRVLQSASANLPNAFLDLSRLWIKLPSKLPPVSPLLRMPAHLSGKRHSRERDRAAIRYHYDVGNEFYALWLDKLMVYSCAYFLTGEETLDLAQEQKLELICRKLLLKPGETLLDIGCGWGGLAIYAAQHYGVTVLGVTLSEQQHQLANQRIAAAGLGHSAVKLLDYRDLRGQVFDKIASVGMFEHIGHDHLSEYFAHVYNLLKPGGLFLNHGISSRPSSAAESMWSRFIERRVLGAGSFIQRYIFPDGELVPVSEVNQIAERTGFEVRHLENLREHYALTLRHWVARLENHHAEVAQLLGEASYRAWKLYMSAAVLGFESGALNVNQTLLQKPQNGLGHIVLPDSKRCCE